MLHRVEKFTQYLDGRNGPPVRREHPSMTALRSNKMGGCRSEISHAPPILNPVGVTSTLSLEETSTSGVDVRTQPVPSEIDDMPHLISKSDITVRTPYPNPNPNPSQSTSTSSARMNQRYIDPLSTRSDATSTRSPICGQRAAIRGVVAGEPATSCLAVPTVRQLQTADIGPSGRIGQSAAFRDTASAVSRYAASAVSREAAPMVSRDAAPMVSRDAAPMVSRDAAPAVSRDAAPAVSRDAAPAVCRGAAPAVSRDAAPGVSRDAAFAVRRSAVSRDAATASAVSDDFISHRSKPTQSAVHARSHPIGGSWNPCEVPASVPIREVASPARPNLAPFLGAGKSFHCTGAPSNATESPDKAPFQAAREYESAADPLCPPYRPHRLAGLLSDTGGEEAAGTLSAVVSGADKAPVISLLSARSAQTFAHMGVKTCSSCSHLNEKAPTLPQPHAGAQYVVLRGPDNSPMVVLLSNASVKLLRSGDRCIHKTTSYPKEAEHAYRVGPLQYTPDPVAPVTPQCSGRWQRSTLLALDEVALSTLDDRRDTAFSKEELNDALSCASSNDMENVELSRSTLEKRASFMTPTGYESVDLHKRPTPTQQHRVSKLSRKALSALISLRESKKLQVKDFEQPVRKDYSAGGTASFFDLSFIPSRLPKGRRIDAFIGKDLAHARDEIDFYLTLKELANKDPIWERFANRFCLFSPGVLSLLCQTMTDPPVDTSLLLLENMKSGINQFRFLDIKIGYTTALAGWKGKSHMGAWNNRQIDSRTNTVHEGCRIEGVQGIGQIFDDYVIAACTQTKMAYILKDQKLRKFALQNVNICDCFSMFFDMRENGNEMFAHSEKYIHRVLIQLWTQLEHCCALLDEINPPQQWLGSSLGLGFDTNPSDANGEVISVARLFDWGRSALETMDDHLALPEKEQRDRDKYWLEYYCAIQRLCWELGRYTFHRALCPVWSAVVIEFGAWDGKICLMGLVTLTPCSQREVELVGLTKKCKEGSMVVAVSHSQDDYTVTILRAEVSRSFNGNPKKPNALVYCVAFERQDDAEKYFEHAKTRATKSQLSAPAGRAFSHPSRIFTLTGCSLEDPETFYLAASPLAVYDLDLPAVAKDRWQTFAPDLRYINEESYIDSELKNKIPQGLKKTRETRKKRKAEKPKNS